MKAFLKISHSSQSILLLLLYHFPSQMGFSLIIIYEYLIPNENIEFCYLRGQHLFVAAMSALLVGDFRI